MKYTEFQLHADAFHDAVGDLPWTHIMALLDKGDAYAVGEFLERHFRQRKEMLEDELPEEPPVAARSDYPVEERLDRHGRGRECNR